ncbi:MAG TPA: FHA domain-containing protein [Candidatus Binataceae bacterium]|nr:FHA domain-containing protein [Candidatus Binataceae bacterium]HVB82906.1 FHA domain-containing protein [Candidatus Binataceae bacterium]
MADERRFSIGRANDCDIPIADDSVSRRHAEIALLDGDRLMVRDLGSQNGTRFLRQGREFPVREEVVFLSDLLRFGDVTVAARDLIDLLKSRSPEMESPRPVARGQFAAPARGAAALIRCECGAIKAQGAKCPVCRE